MAIKSGIGRERARRRRKLLVRVAMVVAVLGIFVGIGFASYKSGSILAARQVIKQRWAIERLEEQVAAGQVTTDRLQAELSRSQLAVAALQQRYDANVPVGSTASLVTILRQKQAAGIKEERIAQVLRDLDAPIPCSADKVARRRFPIGTGTEEGTSFMDGLIQVSVVAPPNTDAAKAWVVTITRAWSPQPIKLTGLPAQQMIPLYNSALRLTVEPSDMKGFLTAALSTCPKS